ncbi:zinc finger protein 576, tandem duplicate 1 isoform 2-T4 [Spinachia spinachia]
MQCLECHIIFSDYKSKVRHMKLSHPAEYEECILGNALFACYICDRHFTNSTELMVHQKAHTEKTPFKCPICGQSFHKSSELTFHKKNHFGGDGYACTDCGKLCKTMTLLKYHRRTHTGERPYVCKECGKRYITTKALQRHIVSHLPEGAEGDGVGNAAKTQPKKADGATTIKYPCCVCKATFKTLRTRLHHMKTKHNMLPAAARKALSAGLQVKQGTPIITPISIHQTALLQAGPNGPLQKVDANIDTEQICRLIESLGNVQKVNQVVILGQVPPNAPPLEVQQVPQLAETMHLNPHPAQIDCMRLKETESKVVELDIFNNPIVSMEQTIILEPITPDGQLENPSFAELGSHMAVCENVELTLVQTEHAERSEGDVTHQIIQQSNIVEIQADPIGQIICQNEVEQDLEQTVILELIPTVDLEQCQTVPYDEIPPSCLVPTTDLEKTSDHAALDEQEISLSTPLLMNTVELQLAPLGTEQQDLPSYPFHPPDTLTQTTSALETNLKEPTDSQMKTVSLDQGQPVGDGDTPHKPEEKPGPSEQVSFLKLLVDSKESQEEVENKLQVEDPAAKEEVSSNLKAKQVSELPVNVMSAQELVKVRKRKPTRAFIFQGHRQELVGCISQDDFQMNASPSKRRKTPQSRLVVKFGPQSKEKKNKKQKKPSQQSRKTQQEGKGGKKPTRNPSEKKGASQKKGSKGKTDKKIGHLVSLSEIKSHSTQNPELLQIKGDKIINKMKKQKDLSKEGLMLISEKKTVALPVFKKKTSKIIPKEQPNNAKNGKLKKNLAEPEKVKTNASTAAADVPSPQIKEDVLLLLKGHKQPQLKVYKLDPSKASGQTQASPHDPQTLPQESQGNKLEHSISDLKAGGKNKGGGPKKKGFSLLSSLQVSHQTPETQPSKPKKTRKRKASSNVETEGVITSNSKRALECKECGQRFSDVSSLQKHKTVHIVESPGLTYTNGNIFEGVSGLNIYHLPKQPDKVSGAMNAASDWDIEPELADIASEGRERSVSFPALVPSPSLPVSPSDVEVGAYENKADGRREADYPSNTFPQLQSPSDQRENCETRLNFPCEPPLNTCTQKKTLDTGEPSASEPDMTQEGPARSPICESKDQLTTEEDIKEDLLLEVDLVTVGEQSERDEPTFHKDIVPQNKSSGTCNSMDENTDALPGQVSNETAGMNLTSQTVSCSTHHVEIKEEEEELLVHNKEAVAGTLSTTATSRRRGTGRLKRGVASKSVSVGGIIRGTELVKEKNECVLIYEERPISSDSEIDDECETTKSAPQPEISLIADQNTPPTESKPKENVGLELESTTTGEKGLQGREDNNKSKQSPDIVLEKILISATAEKEPCPMSDRNNHRQGLDSTAENESRATPQEIKVEESVSAPALVELTCQNRQSASVQPQHHRDVRTVLVKEETSLVRHEAQATQGSIRWNVEAVDIENSPSPLMESGETASDNGCITPECNTDQCIFYPVKEEQRDVPLGTVQTNSENLTTAASIDAQQTERQETDSNSSVADTEGQHPPDVSHFLLQSSDEEDAAGFQLSDPSLDSEAEAMAYFYKNQKNTAQELDTAQELSKNLPTSTSLFQAPGEDNGTREPIDYFSNYFGWDTWVEMANCTNNLSNMTKPVTATEVAQFVGIHIAMGTLKFPSPKLYWEDLTKVPLIADAVPLSRFLELSRGLKLPSRAKDPVNSNVPEERHDSDFQNAMQGKAVSSRPSEIPQRRDERTSRDSPNDPSGPKPQPDPLWKAQPLLSHFKAACRALRREGDYAVDQYILPLPGKMQNKKLSLYCTTLIGFGGFLLHVDLQLGLSGKEDAVEKMVPKGSIVFLCKPELSTPAMLERLLAAGVHGAGRVGGTRGQIGDEFVSSDGKLMLRRSHCGFILSTAGNAQKNTASLIEDFEKAQMSARLNRELQNLYSIPLTASAPSCWPQAVLWYLTDLALVNSWLSYRQDHGAESAPLTFMSFRLEVSKALILCSGSDTQHSVPPQPPKDTAQATNETPNPSLVQESPLPDAATRYDGSGHWPEQLGEVEGGRCRFGDCQRTSRVMCLKCCVFLCISRNHNCFLNFHNQGSLEEV